MWLKDDGGADIKGSVTVQDREGSIEVIGFGHGLNLPVDNSTGKVTGTRSHSPMGMANTKIATVSQLNHTESVSILYDRITWHYVDGNIRFTDSWSER
nr:type VI secretion system tube protein Hcp [Paraburkholderia rhizosphaerae]